MSIRFAHTNIVSRDWKKLSAFYVQVFDCTPSSPTHLEGDWLTQATGVQEARIKGQHLKLPGFDKNGPTLEIFQYAANEKRFADPRANREGFSHIAFQVDDVPDMEARVLSAGGSRIGEIATKEYGKGSLTFTYVADPEGNIIELMKWTPK